MAVVCDSCKEVLVKTAPYTYRGCSCKGATISVIKCALCREDATDFGERFNFYIKNKEGGLVSLRCLCDDCAREISISMILWSDHISKILLQRNQEKQPYSCESCKHIGRLSDFAIEGEYNLKCPTCGHIKKVVPIG
jgi:hypothetical protein